jgi:integrase
MTKTKTKTKTKTRIDRRRSDAERASKRNLDKLAQAPGRYPVADAKGLFLKTKAPGKASWTYRYRIAGRENEISFGAYPGTSIEQAIAAHAQTRAQIVRGVDPRATESAPEASTGADSFKTMADAYIAAKRASWTSARHRQQWVETIDNHCAAIAPIPVDKIDRNAVLGVLTPIWSKLPETARRVRNRIEIVLDYAYVKLGIEDKVVNPARWKGKLEHVLPGAKPSPENFAAMPYAEVPAFVASLRTGSMMGARALEYLILTAVRLSETTGMKWSEVDLDAKTWAVPKERMKGKLGKRREHRVPLSDRALEILEAQRRADSAYVFPGLRKSRPMSAWALTAAARAAGADCTVHGFRSSFRDFAGDETSFPREVAEAALAHAVGDTVERRYRRGDAFAKRRELMQAWADHCAGKRSGKVVAFPSRA